MNTFIPPHLDIAATSTLEKMSVAYRELLFILAQSPGAQVSRVREQVAVGLYLIQEELACREGGEEVRQSPKEVHAGREGVASAGLYRPGLDAGRSRRVPCQD